MLAELLLMDVAVDDDWDKVEFLLVDEEPKEEDEEKNDPQPFCTVCSLCCCSCFSGKAEENGLAAYASRSMSRLSARFMRMMGKWDGTGAGGEREKDDAATRGQEPVRRSRCRRPSRCRRFTSPAPGAIGAPGGAPGPAALLPKVDGVEFTWLMPQRRSRCWR